MLSNTVENLQLLGGGNLSVTGNAEDNVLRGNRGGDNLDGGAGAGIMRRAGQAECIDAIRRNTPTRTQCEGGGLHLIEETALPRLTGWPLSPTIAAC